MSGMSDPVPIETNSQKVPSSPREFFAKIYESPPTESKDEGLESSPSLLQRTLVEPAEIRMGMNSLLWPPAISTAAATLHWNWVQNLSMAEGRAVDLNCGAGGAGLSHLSFIPPALNTFCKFLIRKFLF